MQKLTGQRSQCGACGENFISTRAFDGHRRGEYDGEPPHFGRTCLPPEAMAAMGWKRTDGKWWSMPMSEAMQKWLLSKHAPTQTQAQRDGAPPEETQA